MLAGAGVGFHAKALPVQAGAGLAADAGFHAAAEEVPPVLAGAGEGFHAAAEEVPADYSAPEFEVGFNYRYLLDILGQVGSAQVDVHLADAAAPTLIRENDDSRALYVLMPMRV